MEASSEFLGATGVGARATERHFPRRSTVFDFVPWAMLALWVFVMAVSVSIGSYSGELSKFESDLQSGRVTSVSVTPGMPPTAEGVMTQSIYWRTGVLTRRADVLMVTPGEDSEALTGDDAMEVRSGYDIAEQIAAQEPAVLITRVPQLLSYAQVYGFQGPSWLAGFVLVGAIGTLMALVSGPQPWRATRWGWFWILSTGIGVPLFLILAGPTPPLRAPREQHRRLTGGWALLFVVVYALLKN